MIAVKYPDPDLLLLDKLLVTAADKGIRAVVCINKIDLDKDSSRDQLRSPYTRAGYDVVETSFLDTEGFNKMKDALRGTSQYSQASRESGSRHCLTGSWILW